MKSPQAFRSIGEVAQMIGVATHVLRYWETQFPALAPVRRPDGRRYYRPEDVQLAAGLCVVLREEGLTIRGARRLIALDRGEGVRARGRERLAATAGPPETGSTGPAATGAGSRPRKPGPDRKPARNTAEGAPRPAAAPASPALPLFPELGQPSSPAGQPPAPQSAADHGTWLARLTATAGALRRHSAPLPSEAARLRHDLGHALHRARSGAV